MSHTNYIQSDCIQFIKRLQIDSGQNLLKILVDVFLEQGPDALNKMKAALESRDMESLKREAHNLKSSSGTLGVKKVFEICKSIEDETTLSDKPSIDHLSNQLNSLNIEMLPSLEALKELMRHSS